jgi:hypothetical protein
MRQGNGCEYPHQPLFNEELRLSAAASSSQTGGSFIMVHVAKKCVQVGVLATKKYWEDIIEQILEKNKPPKECENMGSHRTCRVSS